MTARAADAVWVAPSCLTAGVVSLGWFRTAEPQRRMPPRTWLLGATDRIIASSACFSSPLRTELTSVYAWSVIPRETLTGSIVLSGWSFQTTAVSCFGGGGRFCRRGL